VLVRETETLLRRAAALAPGFRAADPFPHVVIDGLFDDATLARAVGAFPAPDAVPWYRYDNALERKLAMPHVERLAPELRGLFHELQSPPFVRFVEVLTGIERLVADDDLVGAGLHLIERGGHLDVHVDSNRHPVTMFDRRVNVLVFLNQEWAPEYGGHLELWDAAMTRPVRRILPVFNRTVIFACTEHANHGHPEPLACPSGRSRKSVAVYYYSQGRPENERSGRHSTIYKRRPQDPDDRALDLLRARRAGGRLDDRTTIDVVR
jgi:hypothetical protein